MSSLYDALFAGFYDRGLRRAETAGLREMRSELLAAASGVTVEIGAGTGLNLEHYPPAVSELVLTEPSAPMAARLRARLQGLPRAARLVETGGEALPLDDGSADTAVATLVLCTVPDPAAVLGELRRVLRPGGVLLFLEHVRAHDARLARWQDRLHRPVRWLGNGCNCNRDTRAAIEAAGFEIERLGQVALPLFPWLLRPGIVGLARRPAAGASTRRPAAGGSS